MKNFEFKVLNTKERKEEEDAIPYIMNSDGVLLCYKKEFETDMPVDEQIKTVHFTGMYLDNNKLYEGMILEWGIEVKQQATIIFSEGRFMLQPKNEIASDLRLNVNICGLKIAGWNWNYIKENC